jgi:hypothetical protein
VSETSKVLIQSWYGPSSKTKTVLGENKKWANKTVIIGGGFPKNAKTILRLKVFQQCTQVEKKDLDAAPAAERKRLLDNKPLKKPYLGHLNSSVHWDVYGHPSGKLSKMQIYHDIPTSSSRASAPSAPSSSSSSSSAHCPSEEKENGGQKISPAKASTGVGKYSILRHFGKSKK